MLSNTWIQVWLNVAMFLTTAIAGYLPIKVVDCLERRSGSGRTRRILSLLSCFSGGVFLATFMIDIHPHIDESYQNWKLKANWTSPFAWPEFFDCIGVFMVWFIEELSLLAFKGGEGHGHGHGHSHGGHGHHSDAQKELMTKRTEKSQEDGKEAADPNADRHSLHSMVRDEAVDYMTGEGPSSVLKSITFAISMSLHSIFEGFALGVQETPSRIITLFISLILHKGIEAFSVGLQIVRGNRSHPTINIITIFIYSIMTPLGAAIGVLLHYVDFDPIQKEGAVIVLECLATGTFIYVTFLEVIAEEKLQQDMGLAKAIITFVGFVAIAALQLLFAEQHGGHSPSAYNGSLPVGGAGHHTAAIVDQ